MAQQTDSQLRTSAGIIRNETAASANTATRVGSMFVNTIDSKVNTGSLSKDATLSANSDTLIPSQKAVKDYITNSNGIITDVITVSNQELLDLGNIPKVVIPYNQTGGSFAIPQLHSLVIKYYNGTTPFTNTIELAVSNTIETVYLMRPRAILQGTNTTSIIIAAINDQVEGYYQDYYDWGDDFVIRAVNGNPRGGDGYLTVYVAYTFFTMYL